MQEGMPSDAVNIRDGVIQGLREVDECHGLEGFRGHVDIVFLNLSILWNQLH